MKLGDATKMNVSVISSGSLAIDLALGVGGLPRGRIVEIYGPESSGKTTFCLSVIAEAQRRGGNAVFVDVEHALDPRYAKIVGVDLDNLMVSQPESGEDALNITETLIRSGAIDVIVVDSVAALVSRQELDGQMGDTTVGLQARMMSQAMRRLTAAISKTNCVCIFTNQIREKIGVMFGSPETTPGGRALKFFCSVRMDIRRIGQIKEANGTVTGSRTRLKIVKNKVAPPFTACEFDIMYNEGISKTGSVIDLGIDHQILAKKSAWISYEGISWAKEEKPPSRLWLRIRSYLSKSHQQSWKRFRYPLVPCSLRVTLLTRINFINPPYPALMGWIQLLHKRHLPENLR